jgi:hypothetical protein
MVTEESAEPRPTDARGCSTSQRAPVQPPLPTPPKAWRRTQCARGGGLGANPATGFAPKVALSEKFWFKFVL